jgi:hypothetical protein
MQSTILRSNFIHPSDLHPLRISTSWSLQRYYRLLLDIELAVATTVSCIISQAVMVTLYYSTTSTSPQCCCRLWLHHIYSDPAWALCCLESIVFRRTTWLTSFYETPLPTHLARCNPFFRPPFSPRYSSHFSMGLSGPTSMSLSRSHWKWLRIVGLL